MVRIKERYLLINILYPPDAPSKDRKNIPDFVLQHQPTVEKLTPQLLLKAVRAEIGQLFGDYGLGALGGHLSGKLYITKRTCHGGVRNTEFATVKYLSLATSTFILRCSRDHYKMLWAALTVMDHVPVKDGRPCIFRVVRVSGTIRKAEEEAIRQARALVLAAKEGTQHSAFLPTDTDDHIEEGEIVYEDTDMASDVG
jgi:ribonuclease P/MRP protein subunit POP5